VTIELSSIANTFT